MRLVVLGGFMGFSGKGEPRVVLSGSWARWEGSGRAMEGSGMVFDCQETQWVVVRVSVSKGVSTMRQDALVYLR